MQVQLKIIKSNRKTMALSINRDAQLVARVPYNYNKVKLDAFISEKSNWILKHIKAAEQNNNKYLPFMAENGAKLTMFGNEYTLILKPNVRAKIVDNTLILPTINTQKNLIKLIKKFALNYLKNRVDKIATMLNFNYNNIKIGSAKTVYGSCNTNNDLNFSYKLMFTPYVVIDYIIIHELCHTKVKNHSAKFYKLVKNCMPNYKVAEQWLKENKGVMNYL